ncbi:hypothetical protein SAFG77S_06725 [Streptomyces afghaniensis]
MRDTARSGSPPSVHVRRRSRRHDPAARVAAARAEIDDPVRARDDGHVVLDDDHGVPGVDEAVQPAHEDVHVGRVEAGRRLVEEVERVAAPAALEFARQLDALGLTARELGRGLTEAEVAEAHVEQGAEAAGHGRGVGEELRRALHRQIQHLRDVPPPVRHLQRLRVVPSPAAVRAGRVRARQEQQLHADEPLALAGLAAPARHVEGEPADTEASRACPVGGREHLAYDVEKAGVRREVRTRRASDRLLIHRDQPAHAGRVLCELPDERRLAGAGHPGDRGERAERELGGHTAQVVPGDRPGLQPPARFADLARRAGGAVEQVASRRRLLDGRKPGDRAAVQHPPAVLAGARTHLHQPVGTTYDIQVVLHHEHRVPGRLQPLQHDEQRLGVRRVQPGRRLVEDVDDTEQAGAQLGGQAQSLQLARGEGGGGPVQAEVAETEFEDRRDARDEVVGEHPGGLGRRVECGGQLHQRQRRQLGDGPAAERHRQCLGPQPAATARRAGRAGEEPLGLRAQGRALGVRERLHHIPAGAHVRALVRPLDPVRVPHRVHGHHRLLVREQDPLTLAGGQLPPRPVHVVPERVEDVPQVLALPGARPRGDRALADRQRRVRDQQLLARTVHPAEPVALRAGPGRRVG